MSDYFDFSKPQKEVISDGIYDKLLNIMCWEMYEGESAEDVFIRQSNNLNALPHSDVIDIVHSWVATMGGEPRCAISERAERTTL